MSESTLGPDDGAGGGESSHEADVDAGYDADAPTEGGVAGTGGATATASGSGDSHAADIDAGYDDESDSPGGDDSGLNLGG